MSAVSSVCPMCDTYFVDQALSEANARIVALTRTVEQQDQLIRALTIEGDYLRSRLDGILRGRDCDDGGTSGGSAL